MQMELLEPADERPAESCAAGRVEEVHLAPARGAPRVRVERVRAVAGRGLDGDRYCGVQRSLAAAHTIERQVTLVEGEAVDAVRALHPGFCGGDTRRNVVTRGVRLNDLVGRTFRIGGVVLRGVERCDPCTRLARFTWPAITRELRGRGGLRAEVLTGGEIRAGDPVTVGER